MAKTTSPGRPRIEEKDRKQVTIAASCTREFRMRINRAARKRNISSAEFIRRACAAML